MRRNSSSEAFLLFKLKKQMYVSAGA